MRKVVIEPRFDRAKSFSEEMNRIDAGKKFGDIDSPRLNSAFSFYTKRLYLSSTVDRADTIIRSQKLTAQKLNNLAEV